MPKHKKMSALICLMVVSLAICFTMLAADVNVKAYSSEGDFSDGGYYYDADAGGYYYYDEIYDVYVFVPDQEKEIGASMVIIIIVAVIVSVLLFIPSIPLYFAPSIIAKCRNHHNFVLLLLLNIFLGWTFIGWVIGFVWSLEKLPGPQVNLPNNATSHNAPVDNSDNV